MSTSSILQKLSSINLIFLWTRLRTSAVSMIPLSLPWCYGWLHYMTIHTPPSSPSPLLWLITLFILFVSGYLSFQFMVGQCVFLPCSILLGTEAKFPAIWVSSYLCSFYLAFSLELQFYTRSSCSLEFHFTASALLPINAFSAITEWSHPSWGILFTIWDSSSVVLEPKSVALLWVSMSL